MSKNTLKINQKEKRMNKNNITIKMRFMTNHRYDEKDSYSFITILLQLQQKIENEKLV